MSDFSARVMTDIKTAMKAKDAVALTALRALKTALTNAAIEKGGLGTELEEGEALAVVRKQVKQRQDSYQQFTDAGRAELAEKEEAEIKVLEGYLPQALSAEELEKLVDEAVAEAGATSRADMGKVMKLAQEKAAGRAEGKVLSAAVMKRLS
ncbi:MAG: GatB/YqeY domain-containing protein [Verrucomicrobiales bacterium]